LGVGCGMRDREVGCGIGRWDAAKIRGQNPHTLQVNICECGGVCWEAQCPCTGDFSLGRMYSTVRMRGVRCVCVRSCVYEGVYPITEIWSVRRSCHLPVIEPTEALNILSNWEEFRIPYPPGAGGIGMRFNIKYYNKLRLATAAFVERRDPTSAARTCAGPGRTTMCDGVGPAPPSRTRATRPDAGYICRSSMMLR